MRFIRLGVLATILWTASAPPARGGTIDFGVDILSGGDTNQVANGFWEDSTGYTLENSCLVLLLCSQNSFYFNVETTALAETNLTSANVSFDFYGLSLLENFAVYAFSGGYQFLGSLSAGSLALNLGIFADEITSGLLKIRVATDALVQEGVRLDGANLRVQTTSVPEPASLLLSGLGLAAVAAFRRSRRHDCPTTC